MPHISVVTPVYKAEACLEELYRRLVPVLAGITQDFAIILVEDCGGDRAAGPMTVTDGVSERLLRLPLYYDLTEAEVAGIVAAIVEFFDSRPA